MERRTATHANDFEIKGDQMNVQKLNGFVVGELGYVVPVAERAFQTMYEPQDGTPGTNCAYDMRNCKIENARQAGSSLTLEGNGFELFDSPSAVKNFNDDAEVTTLYYREIEELALDITGGAKAKVFDHLLRQREQGRPSLTMGRQGDGSKPSAVGRVHNDYTETSGMARLNMVFPEVEPQLPFLILNFWRPVSHPAIDTPLALCDARSVSKADWVETDILYPTRKGQIYLAKHSDAHRWHYYPAMQPHEMLVFKTFDSRRDRAARMTPHCAFDDPNAPPDAPLRRSMEIRCLVLLK